MPAVLAILLPGASGAWAGERHAPGPPLFATAPESPAPNQTVAEAEEPKVLSPQRTRVYIGIRAGQQFFLDSGLAPGVEVDRRFRDVAGSGLIGLNIGRYLGLEVAAEFYENDVEASGFGKIGEFTVWTVMPQVRLRYPMSEDRLAPYLFGGVGWGISEFSDATAAGSDPAAPRVGGSETNTVYALGGGLDYFIADNIALNAELKYVSHEADIEVGSQDVKADLDSLLLLAGLRLFFPGPPREVTGPRARLRAADGWRTRTYFDIRIGYPYTLDEDVTTGFKLARDRVEQVIGASIGLDLHRHFGVELAVDHYERALLATPALGTVAGDTKIGEYDVWSIIAQGRVRYPLLDDILVPYLLAGLGVAHSEVNDRVVLDSSTTVPRFSVERTSFIASVGAGVEYFVADNMAVGAQARYLYHRPDADIRGNRRSLDADVLLLTASLRLYFN
jgi:opacity protein-like surface antigen